MTNHAITSLLEYLSNEARNAMHAIVGLMEIRADQADATSEHACLDICRTSADRLLRSIDDMQALFSDQLPVAGAPEEFDLRRSLADAMELLNLSAPETPRRLVLDAPAAAPILVCEDRQAIEEMMTRLLDSALKLAPRGDVRVSLLADKTGISLSVTTPESAVAHQLANWLNTDPISFTFDQSDQVLSAVVAMVAGKRIRALNGTVEVVPGFDAPASLVISLPLRREAATGERTAQTNRGQNQLNVLVVEDCDESYALAELLLKNERLWRASTGGEAIDMVKQRRFDVIFMDVHLPGMNGYVAIRTIRDWETKTGNARTPMVVLSSDDIATQVNSAAQSGCTGFLRKPVRKGELDGLLDRLKAPRLLAV